MILHWSCHCFVWCKSTIFFLTYFFLLLSISANASILLMHHWRPCLKLRSAILIVLSTVVAKDANHRFQSVVEEKRSDRRQSGSFFLAGNVGLCSEIVGVLAWRYEHRIRRREDLLFSFGSERRPGFPKDGPGHLGCRPSRAGLAPLGACPWIDNFRGFGIRFDNTFSLLLHGLFASFAFAFVSMCRSRQAQCFLQVSNEYRNSLYKRKWHLFRPRPQLFAFCLTLWHPFFTPRWQPRALREYTKLRYTYACKSRDPSQSSWLGLPLRSLCCAIHPLSCLHGALLRKPRNFILLASSNFTLLHFILLQPWHAASSSQAADRQAYAYAPGSNKPSRASKPGWLTEKIKKKKRLT